VVWRWLLVGFLLLGFSSSGVFGQSSSLTRDTMYDLLEVASVNDGSFVVDGKSGTLRWGENIAYFFAGSAQFILNGKDVRLNSPIEKRGTRWLVPRVFLEALQLEFSDPVLDDPDLGRLELTWEEMDVGKGVRGLHLFYREGKNDTASLLLFEYRQLIKLDKTLEPLVRKVVDGFTTAQPGKLLYFSIAAQAGAQTPKELEFIQGKTRYTVESGAGLYPLDGVYPASSIGAVKLPAYFDLRAPIRVDWGNASASYVFAR
jgi:hypothetical protein